MAMLMSFSLTACTSETADDSGEVEDASTDEVVEEVEEVEVNTEPMAFGDVGESFTTTIYDETDNPDGYKNFTFQEGSGDCIDKGLPAEIVYTSDNIVKTPDESYVNDWVSLNFMNGKFSFTYNFDEGDADCAYNPVKGVSTVEAVCEKDDADFCTASYQLEVSN